MESFLPVPVGSDFPDPVGGRLDEIAELLLALPQGRFHALPYGDFPLQLAQLRVTTVRIWEM